jgi:hypothetical protein
MHISLSLNVNTFIIDNHFSELESNLSHSRSTHKLKRKKAPVLSNPAFEHLQHYVNTNFQPDFHTDGKQQTFTNSLL